MNYFLSVSAPNTYAPTYQFPDDDKSDTKSVDGMFFLILKLSLTIHRCMSVIYNHCAAPPHLQGRAWESRVMTLIASDFAQVTVMEFSVSESRAMTISFRLLVII